MNDYPDEFLKAINNEDKLSDLYSKWLEELFSSHLWNEDSKDGMRIPWMKAENAFTSQKDIFDHPGLYIFGTKENVPIYLGMSGKKRSRPLKERLRSRYFGSKSSQFRIAKENEIILKEKGYQALPKDVLEWYHKGYGSNVRLKHAEELAKRGIDGIWFAGLPFPENNLEEIREVERKIIPIANSWNNTHNFPKLLNKQDI